MSIIEQLTNLFIYGDSEDINTYKELILLLYHSIYYSDNDLFRYKGYKIIEKLARQIKHQCYDVPNKQVGPIQKKDLYPETLKYEMKSTKVDATRALKMTAEELAVMFIPERIYNPKYDKKANLHYDEITAISNKNNRKYSPEDFMEGIKNSRENTIIVE